MEAGKRNARAVIRVGLLMLWLLGIGSAIAGCAGDTDLDAPVVPEFGEADEDLTNVLEELLASARAAPDSGPLRGRLAMAYDVNGFEDAAIITYRQAQTLDPREFSWPYFRALLLGQKARFDAALEAVDQAIAIDAGYVPTWLWRGTWLLEQDRFDEAAAAFQRAADLGAGSPAATGLGRTLLRQGRFEEAVAVLEPVNAALPHAQIHRMLGRAYRALGRTEDARVAMARGKEAEPLRWMDPRLNARADFIAGFGGRLVYAQDLIRSGLPRKALQAMEPVRRMRPDDPVLISTLAWAHTQADEYDLALDLLRKGLAAHPDYYRFHLYFARVYLARKESGRAREHLEQALAADPAIAWAHEQLGLLATREQRLDDALANFDAALRYGAENPVKVLHTAAMIEGSRERWPEAIERFERAVAIDQAFTIGYIYLGRSLAEAGRFDEAEEALAWAERLGTHPNELAAAHARIAGLRERG